MTDFYDDDLDVRRRSAAPEIRMGPGGEKAPPLSEPGASSDIPLRGVSDLNLTTMARHREKVDDQVATAMKELEKLRQRQQDLEKKKSDLEDLRRRQSDFERGKREMLEHLGQSLVVLEKEQLRAEQKAGLLGEARKQFKIRLEEVHGLNEESWEEASFRENLTRALAVIDEARTEYNKTMARIDMLSNADSSAGRSDRQPVIFEESRHLHGEEKGFADWIKIGLAFSLPLIIIAVLLALFFYLMNMGII